MRRPDQNPSRQAPRRIRALTGLRFFAAFYVLFYHSGRQALMAKGLLPPIAANFFSNGYLGVTFFFILSGFVLTHAYHRRLSERGDMEKYAVARLARILPVYFLSLLLMIPFVEWTSLSYMLPQLVLLQSWLPLGQVQVSAATNWNMEAWTLSVELFFYLMFPILLGAMRRASDRGLVCGVVVSVALFSMFRLPGIYSVDDLTVSTLGYLPSALLRLPEFTYGALLGMLYCRGYRPSHAGWLYAVMVASVFILCSSDSLWVAPAISLLVGVIILMLPRCSEGRWLGRVLGDWRIVLLGGASYCIYILQSPVHWIVHSLCPARYAFIGRLAYPPILLGFSILIFLFFEEPARRWLRDTHRKRIGSSEKKPVTNLGIE